MSENLTDIEKLDSEELIEKDLGKSMEDVYDLLEGTEIQLDDTPVTDPKYYNGKITEVRKKITIVQKEYTRLLRARTRAQNRLTNLETRYEILSSAAMEDDMDVRAGQSIEDRKARTTNRLKDVKNAIRNAKNEVEAIKNLEKAVNLVLKNLQQLSADLKQQSKLVEIELKHMSLVAPGVDEEVDALQGDLDAIEKQFEVGVDSVSGYDEEDLTEELSFADEDDDDIDETEDSDESVLSKSSEENVEETEFDEEVLTFEDEPFEPSPSEEPELEESDTELTLSTESGTEEPWNAEGSDEGEDDLDFSGLSLDEEIEESFNDDSYKELLVFPEEETLTVDSEGDSMLEDFEVESIEESEPKVSKVFAEDLDIVEPPEEEIEEVKVEEPKNDRDDDLDDVLATLGL